MSKCKNYIWPIYKTEKSGKKEFWDGMYPQRTLIQTPPNP